MNAEQFFSLPPIRRYDHAPEDKIASEVFTTLPPESRAALMDMPEGHQLAMKYAAFANPTTGTWATPDPDLVLEYVPVGVLRMNGLVFLINGRRFVEVWDGVGVGPANYTLQTWDEFEYLSGKSVKTFVNSFVAQRTASLHRAIKLSTADVWHTAKLTYCDPVDMTVGTATVTYWVDDQIDRYLEKRNIPTLLAKEVL